ncbi:MAG: LytTR family DNA-binding domain-containing protein [Saprospiraceae bacterium]|nr:LytTR family DNA-binding domain-containing protein [Saprospiraceae bacterium]
MELKALIIDDEEAARVSLMKLLEWNAPEIVVAACCKSVDEGLEAIGLHHPNVIFLDIEMPVKNGFDLLKEVQEVNFEIIFITAYDEFAIEAFKQHALAYLLKPIDEEELRIAIKRVKQQLPNSFNESSIVKLFDSLKIQQPQLNKIAIPTMEGLELIKVESIIRCSSEGNYTRIYLLNDETILVSKTLKQIENQLSAYSQFVRVHNSHMVNLLFVKRYQKGKGGSLIMDDLSMVPVSRARKEFLLDQF